MHCFTQPSMAVQCERVVWGCLSSMACGGSLSLVGSLELALNNTLAKAKALYSKSRALTCAVTS